MQLRFKNSYHSPVWVSVMWYSPDACGGDGAPWETRGWWHANPGATVTTNVSTGNRYFCFYAEAANGAVWGGPYGAQVSVNAYDGCIDVATIVDDGPSPYFNVGFRLVDAGWWHWSYSSYTVNLV